MNLTALLVMDLVLVVITVLLAVARRLLVHYGACRISINREKTLEVEGGGYLLNYFTTHKIFIPSACGGKATCGHCKVKVLSGAGPILPTEEVYIDREEKASGVRLACQVKVKGDVEIYVPEYLLETKEYRARVERIEEVTHDIKKLIIALEDPREVEFRAGQYMQIKVPGTEEFRAYSIASPPSRREGIELIVRLVPGGLCSSFVHFVLEAGNELTLTGPFGDFFLQEDSGRDIVCIGGGCGMAPIRSIVLHLAERGMPRKLTYFFGARARRDLFYGGEFDSLEKRFPNFRYIPALSEPRATDRWRGETGIITRVVEKHIDDAAGMEAYLCGPPPMIDAAIEVLTRKGMNARNIYYDKF